MAEKFRFGRIRTSRRMFVRLEKFEQAAIVRLLNSMGAEVFVLGTRRPRAVICRNCHMPVQETQGTRQSPGLPDVITFLKRPGAEGRERDVLMIEAKRFGTKLRPDQIRFQHFSNLAGVRHVVGTLDNVIQYLVEGGYLRADQVAHFHSDEQGHAPTPYVAE